MIIDPLEDGISRIWIDEHMGDDFTPVKRARASSIFDEVQWRGEKDEKLIRFLLREKHWAPFQHPKITFAVKCPIFVARQWHRHSSWDFSELSRRHTSDNIEIYIPEQLRYQDEKNRQASSTDVDPTTNTILIREIKREAERDVKIYERMISNNVAREQARYSLPVSLYTSMYCTASLRSIFHFVALRDHEDAQPEISKYAQAIKELSSEIFPVCWQQYDLLQQ